MVFPENRACTFTHRVERQPFDADSGHLWGLSWAAVLEALELLFLFSAFLYSFQRICSRKSLLKPQVYYNVSMELRMVYLVF